MYERSSSSRMAESGCFFLGFLTGMVIAGAAVMLYAPKSGPETRNLLRDEVMKTQQMLQSWAEDVKQRAEEISQIIRFGTEKETQTVGGNGQDKSF